jgi:hypothetical protein
VELPPPAPRQPVEAAGATEAGPAHTAITMEQQEAVKRTTGEGGN